MIVTAILHAPMLKAALILILGMSLIPFGDSAGKLLVEGQGVSPLFVAWSRFALGALLFLPFLGRRHHRRAYYADWRLWFRSALIAGGIVCILTALGTEALPNVFGAFFVGPIVSYILSVLLLGERVTLARSLLVALGFAGVLLVVRPGFGMTPGLLYAALAGVFYGSYLTASRWLRDAAPPRALLLTQLVGGAVLTLPAGLLTWPPIDLTTAGLIGWSAAASMGGNLLLILAYGMAPATRLAPFIYFQLVFAAIYGVLIFGDVPDAMTLAGLVLLIGSGFASLALRR